jgi:hypothetical protein
MPASNAHQELVLWVARKMTVDGFLVLGCDGSSPQDGLWGSLPWPFEMRNRRPDLCGLAPESGAIAIGEAKTWNDIDTAHTRSQLQVFGRVKIRSTESPCRLYLAVPRSAACTLDRVLGDLGLLGARHVSRLHIPDCFITAEHPEYA